MRVFLNPHPKFGVFIRDYLSFVHAWYKEGDVICCKKEWEYYLPGPCEEITDAEAWTKYGKSIAYIGNVDIKPSIVVSDPIECDIVISPRAKCGDRKDNYDWAGLVTKLKAAGRHVTVIGHEKQSQEVKADQYSWNIERGDIRLMAGAKMAITLDSGVGHLASLLNTPQLVIYEKSGYENANLELEPGLYSQMRFNDMAAWNERFAKPVYSQDEIMAIVNSEIIYVTDKELEYLKGFNVSSTKYKAGSVFHSPNATLIMRSDGNTYTKTPGLIKKAFNLTVTIAEATAGVIAGDDLLVPELVANHRMQLCKSCSYHDAEAFCRSCGCITEAKVKLTKARCPIGLWSSL
jgi:hypothetical protein